MGKEKKEEKEEAPELLGMDLHEERKERKHWKPNPMIEDQALNIIQETGMLPTDLRASPAMLEEFYHHGYMLYKFGRYEDAQNYFNMVNLADPGNSKYLMALAASLHMQKQYLSAIQMYSAVMYFEPDNPLPLYHGADCYIKIFQPLNAAIALEMAIEKCREPKHEALKDRMILMVQRLNKELDEQMKESQDSFIGESGRKLRLVDGEVILD